MKKVSLFLLAFCFMAALAFAQDEAKSAPAMPFVSAMESAPAMPETLMLTGDIIDNTCANANQYSLADFVKTHTKQCATAPACIESGYSIFADDKLYKFNKDSNVKVVEFLKKKNSKLQVVVVAEKINGELSLSSIENQK